MSTADIQRLPTALPTETLAEPVPTAVRTSRPGLSATLVTMDAAITVIVVGLLASGIVGSSIALVFATAVAASLVATFAVGELYRTSKGRLQARGEPRRIALVVAGLAGAWLLAALLVNPGAVGRPGAMLAITGVLLLWPAIVASRGVVWRQHLRRCPERVLIIGAGATGQEIARTIHNRPGGGVEVAGFVDDAPLDRSGPLADIPVLPENADLARVVAETRADRIVLAFSRRPAEEMLRSIRESSSGEIPLSVVPRLFEITPSHASMDEVGGTPVISLQSASLSRGARLTKRLIDITLATTAVVLLGPLLLALAVAIKLDSPGPVFFRQARAGLRGRAFRIFKFRSMRTDAESFRHEMAPLNEMEGSGPLFKMENDPRVTRVGRFLRRTSLDELPQLFNVIGGSMSLVGPRPFVTHESDQIDGWAARRLDLRPGITGLWQVAGRNRVPYEEMARLDYKYVANWSPWWDLRILAQTVPAVLRGTGAS